MIDREKVIRALNCCAHADGSDCMYCPYDHNDENCTALMSMDVLELLKEQEPLPAKYVDKGDSYPPCIYHSVCRACGGILNYPEKFCKACGRGIIWVPFCKEEADV